MKIITLTACIALLAISSSHAVSFFQRSLENGYNPTFTKRYQKKWLDSTFILEIAYLTMHNKKNSLQSLKQRKILDSTSIAINCYTQKNNKVDFAYYFMNNNEEIGIGTIHIDYDSKEGRLRSLEVKPNYQNMQLGKHFFKILMKKLSEHVDIVHWHAIPKTGYNSTLDQLYKFYTDLGATLTLDLDGRSYTASIDPKKYKDYEYKNKITSYIIIED